MAADAQRIKRGRSIDTITDTRREKLAGVLRRRQHDAALVVENVWDPHNVAAILRTADAVGIQDVHLLYHVEKLPNVRRIGKQSSASANKWLSFHVHDSVEACVAALRAGGYSICVSHLTTRSVPLYEIDATGKHAFVVGNESRGVSDELLAAADVVYHIPMMGMVQSLNVSVATAVTLYEVLRQRLTAGLYDRPADEERVRERLEDWARK
ncbi:MAG: RNA methyltransferase [Ignavibacteriae bacterium]|nr:RNA methyltransferase [Ignavibacteriota bacterium]